MAGFSTAVDSWDGRASVEWPSKQVGLVIEADPVFGHLMAHVPAEIPLGCDETFCLEPQTCPPCGFDGLETSVLPGIHLLAPGESVSGNITFRVVLQAGADR